MNSAQPDKTNKSHIKERYWIRHPYDAGYIEITKTEFILAERDNNFTSRFPDEPATASFTARNGIRATTLQPGTLEPAIRVFTGSDYYDRSGHPITVEQWGAEYETDRCLKNDAIETPNGTIYLRTMYLGFIHDAITPGQLYGTALTDTIPTGTGNVLEELETYDSATRAYIGHLGHRKALRDGAHCRHCTTPQHPAA